MSTPGVRRWQAWEKRRAINPQRSPGGRPGSGPGRRGCGRPTGSCARMCRAVMLEWDIGILLILQLYFYSLNLHTCSVLKAAGLLV